jgi:hypothetical protein
MTPPIDDGKSGATSSNLSTKSNPPSQNRSKESRKSPDWWYKNEAFRAAAAYDLAKKHQRQFEMILPPDHLPSSPLCPKNVMHKSQGRGICVYHGRNKSTSMQSDGSDSYDFEFNGLYEN